MPGEEGRSHTDTERKKISVVALESVIAGGMCVCMCVCPLSTGSCHSEGPKLEEFAL